MDNESLEATRTYDGLYLILFLRATWTKATPILYSLDYEFIPLPMDDR